MQILVEIGPSNASQGQHRRKDATEQLKNLTLARTRTQVLGFSSADALPTRLRVPMAEPEFLILIGFSYLKFTPLPSFQADFYSRHVVTKCLTTLIKKRHIFMRTAVLIYIYIIYI